jgi:non-specific serine/threonine protein kinase
MSLSVAITPAGRLHLEPAPDALPAVLPNQAEALQRAFAQSSAEGLRLLASAEMTQQLPPALVFWRDIARHLFHAVCQLGEGGFAQWASAAPPSDEQLAEWVEAAPPMRGLEYLDNSLLRYLWTELQTLVASQASNFPGGPAAYLRNINPLWHLLGRVTFHLAENKRDPDRPFAFLATYTHRMSGQARLQHLPLAEALKIYAAAKDRRKLETLLEPVQRAAGKSELVRELLDRKALFAPQAWSIRQAYRFLTEVPRMEEAGLVVRVPDWWTARRPPRPQVQVTIGKRPVAKLGLDGLLDFDVNLTIDGEPLTEEERRRLLASADGLVLLRGRWVEANSQRLEEALNHWKRVQEDHLDGVSFIEGMRLLAGAPGSEKDADDGATADWSRVAAGDWLRETLERLRRPDQIDACRPGRDLEATLRHYQVDGVRWLWFLTELGLGACLADDMGLGKTIQVIDLLLERKAGTPHGGGKPSLLILPASLIGNWRQELARFAPKLQVFFAHRSECSPEELHRVAQDPVRLLADYDLVITTYALTRRHEWLAKSPWSLVILDEAQAIKNATSNQARAVKKLTAKARIVLTGTPVENHLGDLWSIFDFCCPGLLGTAAQFKSFVKRLNQQQDSRAFGTLRRLVRPYILRRLKTDPGVAPDLPEKTEMRVECGLSKKQGVLYQRAVAELKEGLQNKDGIARKGLVLAALMQFKQICNHPAQYLQSGTFVPADSGKFERLRLVCEPIVERQEKALVFTQFQSLTQPLADFLGMVFGRPGLVLHGGTPIGRRSELVRNFQEVGGPPFFVISLKAGGSGLNLTAATHVIHFDRWWNPAVEDQATDRAFRIGQKRNVLVHKFVCRGTVEERIDAMIREKRGMAEKVLDRGTEAVLTEMSDNELLRFVALDISRAGADE